MRPFPLALLFAAVAGTPLPGAEDASATPSISDSSLKISGIFNADLPGTEHKYQLKLILHPHVGDLLRYDDLRTAVGLRYGISRSLEIEGQTNAYFSHGAGDVGFFKRAGLADWRVGAKYRLGDAFFDGWDTAVGAGYASPIGTPPADVTDGFRHFTPYITFARPLFDSPDLRVFWGLGADFITHTGIPGRHEKNDLLDSSSTVNGGIIWANGAMNYTFEASYATTRWLAHGHEDVFSIRPGFVWAIPRRYTFHSRSQWLFGLAFDVSHGPDGFDVGLGGKLRLSLDFKKLWRRQRDDP